MRRSAAPHNPGVSLFPFLAVLICTMGVMMLLLVVCNRPGAEAAGAEIADGGNSAGGGVETDLVTAREMLNWRIAQLGASRQKTEADLTDRRLRLSAVEEYLRKLREQWQTLAAAAKDLEQTEHAKGEAARLTEAEITRLVQQLNETKGKVAQAADRARNAPPSFAIVPYDGPNGTRRRPIYIECGPTTLTLQPEGIVLTVDDFTGPDGPGNPLATVLRAIRDQMAAAGAQGDPYPLLIVRPDGIEMFYVARQAMASWASDFGYELIEQDRKLAFPASSGSLAQVEQTALADARARYAWFAQTRTGRKEAAGHRPVYRASTSGGGIVRVDRGQGSSQGSGIGGQGSAASDNLVATNNAPPILGQNSPAVGGYANGGFGMPNQPGALRSAPGGNVYGTAANGPRTDSSSTPYGQPQNSAAVADARGPGSDRGSPSSNGGPPGSGSSSPTSDLRSPTSDPGPPPHIPGPGEYVDSQRDLPKPKPEDDDKKPKSLAEKRGRNWSLPSSVKTSVPVSRTIQIECRGDQLVILPDQGNLEPQVIRLGPRTEDSIDQLVSSVWVHTKGWGIAGRQMYWRPVLELHLGPSGEGRCGEVQALMANSGLEVIRK